MPCCACRASDLPRPDAILQEFRRVLVEDGRLVLTLWGTRSGNEWIDLVERALRRALPEPPPTVPVTAAG